MNEIRRPGGPSAEAEALTALNDEKYRLFADATEEGVLIHDYAQILEINTNIGPMFGYTDEQIHGRSPFGLIAPTERRVIEAICRQHKDFTGETLGIRADGSIFPIELNARAINYRERLARIVRVRDLTRRHEVQANLNASEERFRATFELAAVGIAHVATDGTWLRVNRRLCEITGYDREELLRKTFQEITHPDDLDADLEQFDAVIAGRLDSYSMEKRYFRKDGAIVWANLTVSFVRGSAAQPAYFISIVEDITTRKTMEETLRQSEKMDVIGQLTSSIAHDFGNFLNVIKGNLELLEPYQIGRRPSDYLKSALAGTDLAEKLIRQLLSFSRRQEPELQPLDVNMLIRNVQDLLRRAASAQIVLNFLLHGEECLTTGDKAQFETAMFNLILNASDALGSSKGEITVRTSIAADPGGFEGRGYVLVEVIDNGHGMPADIAARASEPFFTTKTAGEGTGLGLSQVARCVSQMNGFIDIESKEAIGTTVRLFLPLNQAFGNNG